MKSSILLPVIAAFAITACNNTTANSTEKSTTEVEKTEAVSTSGNADCLKSHADKGTLDQLLPLDVIKKHHNVPAQAKKTYSYRAEAK